MPEYTTLTIGGNIEGDLSFGSTTPWLTIKSIDASLYPGLSLLISPQSRPYATPPSTGYGFLSLDYLGGNTTIGTSFEDFIYNDTQGFVINNVTPGTNSFASATYGKGSSGGISTIAAYNVPDTGLSQWTTTFQLKNAYWWEIVDQLDDGIRRAMAFHMFEPTVYALDMRWNDIRNVVLINKIDLGAHVHNTTDGTTKIPLSNLADVVFTETALDDTMKYNGAEWVNSPGFSTGAGIGVVYYYNQTSAGIDSYESLTRTLDTGAEADEYVTVNANTVLIDSFASSTDGLGITLISAGTWTFNSFAYVSAATGTTTLTYDVYSRTTDDVETLLFSITTSDIDATSVALVQTSTVQIGYTINATDRLVVKVSATTDNVGDIEVHFVHSGLVNVSSLLTPLLTKHNDLAGLQGGTSNQFYHLTSTEYTGTGTGVMVRKDGATLTGAVQADRIGLGVAATTTYKLNISNGHINMNQVAAPTAATVATGAAGNLTGDYYYRISFVTAIDETEGGTVSALVQPSTQKVELTAIPVSGDVSVTARKIYRTTAGGSSTSMKLVDTISDNTTTVYSDDVTDISLGQTNLTVNTTGGFIYVDGSRIGAANHSATSWGINALSTNRGYYNTAIGANTLSNNNLGGYNTAIGHGVLNTNTTGKDNTGIGYYALYELQSGDDNVAAGESAGRTLTTGKNNTFLGFEAGYHASQKADAENSTAIGNGTYTTASNQIVIGNTSVTSVTINGSIQSPTLVTPNIGAATATTVNKITVTQPATGATLTITDGKTLSVSNDATVSGTNTGDQVVPSNAPAVTNQFVTAYNNSTGAITQAQPTWANVDKTTSDIADITTKSHTSLSSIGTNTHAQIDTAIGTTLPGLITTHAALTTVHGSTAVATVSTIMQRDAAGRCAVVAPAAATDIALKSTVTDDITTHAALTTGVHGAGGSTLATTGNISTHAGLTATHGVTGAIVGTTDTQVLTNKRMTCTAGTTAAGTAPIKLTAGTKLTTPEAGAMEYDGATFYFTTTTGRGVIPAANIAVITGTAFTLNNDTVAQPCLPAAYDTLTVVASTTYKMRAIFYITGASVSKHTTAFGLALGSGASLTSIGYAAKSSQPIAANTVNSTAYDKTWVDTNAATVVISNGKGPSMIQLDGIVRVNAGGTITPQITFSAAPGGTPAMGVNSYIEFAPIGDSTIVNVGAWT